MAHMEKWRKCKKMAHSLPLKNAPTIIYFILLPQTPLREKSDIFFNKG